MSQFAVSIPDAIHASNAAISFSGTRAPPGGMGALVARIRSTARSAKLRFGSRVDARVRSACVTSGIGAPPAGVGPWQLPHRVESVATSSQGRSPMRGPVSVGGGTRAPLSGSDERSPGPAGSESSVQPLRASDSIAAVKSMESCVLRLLPSIAAFHHARHDRRHRVFANVRYARFDRVTRLTLDDRDDANGSSRKADHG